MKRKVKTEQLGIFRCQHMYMYNNNNPSSVYNLDLDTRDVRKELLISTWRRQISSKPKSAHSMPSKNSSWLEMQSCNRCIHFLKVSRYADLGTVIRY